MKKFFARWRLRNPLASPVGLQKRQFRLFSKFRRPKITWRGAGKALLWGVGGFLLVIILLFAWYAKDLPTPGKIRNLAAEGSTRLFDRNMNPLYTISGEKKRIIVDQKDIPLIMQQTTLALEDRNFYNHSGFSLRGITRAVICRLPICGSRVSGGGSTITQQYVKNALLKTNKRTFDRKIKEVILAIELEVLFSKDQILTMYLNEIPYGGNNYGVEAAARSFYGKSAKELTLSQAATLASLPQLPSTLSPYGANTDRLIARRNYAIDILRDEAKITPEEAEAAKKEALGVVPRHESITAPHFALYVKEWLVDYFTKELGDKQLAEQKVENGGLTVVTTLDLEKQKIAEDVMSKATEKTLKRAGASNAALVSLDPKHGDIIAMVGSIDYFQPQFGSFNVATAARQPGSSFKPLVYAASFKEKYSPSTNLFDLKTDFGKYVPENYDGNFRGPITIRKALGNSLNIPAVKILAMIGMDKALKTASDLGITTLTDKDRYGLSLVLGGGEVRPLEMATAYGVFANKGTLVPTSPILKITDPKGKEIVNREEPKDKKEVLDPQVAYQVTSILSDTEAKKPTFNGVMNSLTLKDRPVASKTGTTNAYRDAWTIGYTPQFVTAVWAGNNDNTPMNRAGGSVAAAPIWDDFMERIHQGLPVENFDRPSGIQEVAVDKLSNKLPVDGSEVIKDIFAAWQVPTTKDDVHLRVRVCRENGLLAGSDIPDELAEERTYGVVHSEMPNNPNWEGPVAAWAAANGLNNPPPTQKCEVSGSTQPTISITSPSNGAVVSGVTTITASATASSGVASVEFFVDSTSIGKVTTSPYQITYDTSLLASGNHTVGAIVTSTTGATAGTQITVSVNRDSTPPANITGLNGAQGPGAGKVTLSWVNPLDTDFRSVKIYVYVDLTGVLGQTLEVSSPGTSLTIADLTTGVGYRFVVKSVDTAGNESTGMFVVVTAP